MRGQLGADLEDLERGVGPEDVVDDGDRRAVQDADAHGGAGAGGEPLGVHERARAQLVEVEVGVAELQQPGAELVLVRVAVLLDEAVRRSVCSSPWTVGRERPSWSASSLTPSRRGPLASALRMRAARSTDWIVPRRRLVSR